MYEGVKDRVRRDDLRVGDSKGEALDGPRSMFSEGEALGGFVLWRTHALSPLCWWWRIPSSARFISGVSSIGLSERNIHVASSHHGCSPVSVFVFDVVTQTLLVDVDVDVEVEVHVENGEDEEYIRYLRCCYDLSSWFLLVLFVYRYETFVQVRHFRWMQSSFVCMLYVFYCTRVSSARGLCHPVIPSPRQPATPSPRPSIGASRRCPAASSPVRGTRRRDNLTPVLHRLW